MMVSCSPWWCTELAVCAWAIIMPPQIWEELERSLLMAARRRMPADCGVLRSRRALRVMRTSDILCLRNLDARTWRRDAHWREVGAGGNGSGCGGVFEGGREGE